MKLAEPLGDAGLPVEERARAVLQYIREQIGSFSDQAHPKCKAALQAAFCMMPELANGREYPSITARLKLATEIGVFGEKAGPEAGERNWRRAVKKLATLVDQNVGDLAIPAGWASAGSPSGYQPVFVKSLVVTYFLAGMTVTEIVTERSVQATRDGVDKYIVRDYVQGDRGAQIEVDALFNCKKDRQLPVDLGPGFVAVKADMLLPQSYDKGDGCTFATRVTRRGVTDPTTWQEIQVTGNGIASLTMRVQFDTSLPLPSRCWCFAAMPDLGRLDPPEPDEGRDVPISALGFATKFFGSGHAAAKYGIVWRW